MTLATARRYSRQLPIGITRRTGNWAPRASGPTPLFAAAFVSGISPWRIRRISVSRGSYPHYLFDSRGGAQPRRPHGRAGACRAPRRTLVFTNKRPRPGRRCFDRHWTRRGGAARPTGAFPPLSQSRSARISTDTRRGSSLIMRFHSRPIRSSRGNARRTEILILDYNFRI